MIILPLCVSVKFLCLSLYQSVCLSETRSISDIRAGLVTLNMLKLSSFSFTGAAFVDMLLIICHDCLLNAVFRYKCSKPGLYPVLSG